MAFCECEAQFCPHKPGGGCPNPSVGKADVCTFHVNLCNDCFKRHKEFSPEDVRWLRLGVTAMITSDTQLESKPVPQGEAPKDDLAVNSHPADGVGAPVLDGSVLHTERPNVNAMREALETQSEMEVGKPVAETQQEIKTEEKEVTVEKGSGTQIIINIAGKKKTMNFSDKVAADAFIKGASARFGDKFKVVASELVVLKPGDKITWRVNQFGYGFREGTVIDVLPQNDDELVIFDAKMNDGHDVWGYMGLIFEINGQQVKPVNPEAAQFEAAGGQTAALQQDLDNDKPVTSGMGDINGGAPNFKGAALGEEKKYAIYVGPTLVQQAADILRKAGIEVMIEGVQHVHVLTNKSPEELKAILPMCRLNDIRELPRREQDDETLRSSVSELSGGRYAQPREYVISVGNQWVTKDVAGNLKLTPSLRDAYKYDSVDDGAEAKNDAAIVKNGIGQGQPTKLIPTASLPKLAREIVRCRFCGETFPATDEGKIPLHEHQCPGSGKMGSDKKAFRVIKQHDDGSRTTQLQPGDRIRIVRVDQVDSWILHVGDEGTVIRYRHPQDLEKNPDSSIHFVEIQTDKMRDGGWGTASVPPWFLEYIGDDQANKEGSMKSAAFNLSPSAVPSQVVQEFYPELQHELISYPNVTNAPMQNPEITGDAHELGTAPAEGIGEATLVMNNDEGELVPGDLEGGLTEAIEDAFEGMNRIGYISTSPAGGAGIGRDGKPQVLEGTPLRKENDIRGPMFMEEFNAQYEGIPGNALAIQASAKTAGEEVEQFSLFLKRVMGEVAASFIAAFKVTSKMPMNKVPGVGEIQLAQVEQATTTSTFNLVNTGSRVKYLLDKLTDSQVQDAINGAYAQGAIWHEGKEGGFVYEVFVRAETIDTESMILSYKFVTGTKEASDEGE